MKSPRLDDRTEGLPGTSAARVNRSLRYLGELDGFSQQIAVNSVQEILLIAGEKAHSLGYSFIAAASLFLIF